MTSNDQAAYTFKKRELFGKVICVLIAFIIFTQILIDTFSAFVFGAILLLPCAAIAMMVPDHIIETNWDEGMQLAFFFKNLVESKFK